MSFPHMNVTRLVFWLTLLSFASTLNAQTDSCDNAGNSYLGGPINVSGLTQRLDVTCSVAPADHNITQGTGNGFRAICKDCVPQNYGAERAYTGGTAGCSQYGKKMVIEFQSPVAELRLPVVGVSNRY